MTSLHLVILRSASLLVPGSHRVEWFAEWSAELWHVNRGATAFCLGAFSDALWLRRNNPTPIASPNFSLRSPLSCLLFLAALAAVSVYFAVHLPLARNIWAKGNFVPAYLFMIGLSVLIVSATTSLALDEYPGNRHFRRRIFLVAKITLLLPLVCCGSLDLASVISMSFQSHGLLRAICMKSCHR